jgi:ATP-dependent DNA helicase RecG
VIFPEGKIQNPNRFTEKTFKGSVPTMIREVMSYLQSIAIQEYVIKPKDRMESIRYFNYPYQALEEAVVNAMYHRDYQEYQEVEITIEPNRISILSFSGPDRSIPAEAIKKCESLRSHRCRNNKLGDFLKELELTEGRGTGIPTIQDELAKNGSPRASIETNDERSYFLIDIPVHEGCESVIKLKDDAENNTQRQSNDRVTTEHDRVIQILKFCETPKTRRDILEQIGLKYHSDNFNKYIKPLVEQDLLLLTDPDSPNSPKQKYVTAEKK